MVPSAVVTLSSFPLTPNGKIDRNALPAPSFERDETSSYIAPRTALETRLVKIWERVLGIHPVGVRDDFFELGVTSFVAAQLFAKIEREIGKSLPLGAVFQAPSVERLAELIESGNASRQWTSLVPMQPNGTKPPVFCVHGGAGTILHLQRLTKHLGADQPFYGLQSRGLYGGAAPLRTVEEMAEHYLTEIRAVQPHGPYYLSGYCFGTIVAFDMAQRLREEGEEVALLAMFNGPSPYWLRTYNWIGAQPKQRAARLAAQRPPLPKHRRAIRAVREPQRLARWVSWRLWQVKRSVEIPWARVSLALGRPLAETLRESYFLRTHYIAERAYEPAVVDGEIHVFSGEGLYEDVELGWSQLASGGVRTHIVPGRHEDNRQMMREPYVQSVAEQLAELLRIARSKTEAAPAGRVTASSQKTR
jgi:aspartate racemase